MRRCIVNTFLLLLFSFLMVVSGSRPNGAWVLAGIVALVLLARLGVFRASTWIAPDPEAAYSELDTRDGLGEGRTR